MDTLGPDILSFIERLSSLLMLKMYIYWYNRKVDFGTLKCVLYRKVFFYCVLRSECPLSEVPLYIGKLLFRGSKHGHRKNAL